MVNRLLKWLGFSIGLMVLPIVLSAMMYKVYNYSVAFDTYSSEILFIAVTISATSIGDIVSLIEKQVKGVHITALLVISIFISLVCIAFYEMIKVNEILKLELNSNFINLVVASGMISSLITSLLCQVFLSKVID